MMELLRRWLVGVTCAAMIIALADSLTPSGTVRKVVRVDSSGWRVKLRLIIISSVSYG